MDWWLIVFIFSWIIGMANTKSKPSDEKVKFALAFFKPLIAMGMAFVWNRWARHFIGWPEITTLKEFLIVMVIL